MVVSFLDRRGVRHEVNLETWASCCGEWIADVHTADEKGGRAMRIAMETVPVPVQTLGSMRTEYVAGQRPFQTEEAAFTESDEHITCLACIAELR